MVTTVLNTLTSEAFREISLVYEPPTTIATGAATAAFLTSSDISSVENYKGSECIKRRKGFEILRATAS